MTRLEPGVRFTVDGLRFADVTAWTWAGEDLTGALHAALAEHTAALQDTGVGFEVEWHDSSCRPRRSPAQRARCSAPPPARRGRWTPHAAMAARPACNPAHATPAWIFPAPAPPWPWPWGKVVRVETLHANDHGMGTNIILRHVLPGPNCAIVYSSYAHLASLDAAVAVGMVVARGQTLGAIGGSGHGDPDAFAPHLHLELKARAVTGNPFGVGRQTRTCATDPLNAGANRCWRYVGTAASPRSVPNSYGYLDPADYLRKTHTLPAYRQVSAGGSHTCARKADHTLACWGNNRFGQVTPSAGAFQQVSSRDILQIRSVKPQHQAGAARPQHNRTSQHHDASRIV